MVGPEERPNEAFWKALLEQAEGWNQGAAPRPSSGKNRKEYASEESWQLAEESHKNQEIKEVMIAGYNRGGLVTSLWGLEGFIPASRLTDLRVVNETERKNQLSRYVGQVLAVKVIEVDRPGGRLILAPQDASGESPSAGGLEGLNPGQVVRGRVTRITDFGAFLDLGGVEGLIHVSQLAWERVAHPGQVLKVGDEVEAYILDVDPRRRRVALSRKRLQPDPWDQIAEQYEVGQIVEGMVTRVVEFGAFVRLQQGVEGLIHLSELAEGNFFHPQNVVREGEVVRVRILNVDAPRRRIGLSLRQAQQGSN